MGLKPKVGDSMEFTTFEHSAGEKCPPAPWTGEVVAIEAKVDYLPVTYRVKRDADGKIVTLKSRDFKSYVSKA